MGFNRLFELRVVPGEVGNTFLFPLKGVPTLPWSLVASRRSFQLSQTSLSGLIIDLCRFRLFVISFESISDSSVVVP